MVGIGDDAAVVATSGDAVITTDMLMEGVDFEPGTDPRRVGRKSLAVNLSDLAAMAAEPVTAFAAVALPRSGGRAIAEQLYEGLLALAEEFQITLAGGDTNSWNGPLVISVTAVGRVTTRGPLLRSGARPGDVLLVTGELGGSILGHHFDFQPRVREALWLHAAAELHAGIDVSDGLTLDLARLLAASGCGAVLDLDQIPVSDAARQLAADRADGISAREHALSDGEDFELVIAAPPAEADRLLAAAPPVRLTRIGHCVARPGLWQAARDGNWEPLLPHGYEHQLS
jgi:thiamine-monophosphate kinase